MSPRAHATPTAQTALRQDRPTCGIVNNKSSESRGGVVTHWTIIEIDSDRSDLSSNLMQVDTFF